VRRRAPLSRSRRALAPLQRICDRDRARLPPARHRPAHSAGLAGDRRCGLRVRSWLSAPACPAC
jgi:hypothetical protein